MGGAVSGLISSVGNLGQGAIDAVGDLGAGIDRTVRDTLPGGWTTAALIAAGAYYAPEIGAWVNSAGAPVATTSEVVAADSAAGVVGSTGTGMTASGGGLGLTAGNTANLGAMGGAQGVTGLSTAGTTIGSTGGALSAGGLGAGLGLSSAATGAGAYGTGAGMAGLTSSQLGNLGLIQGGLGLAGGLLQGSQTQDALNNLSGQQASLANQTLNMGKFTPVGTTTRFGTSSFTVDPVTGGLKANYSLSPEAQAYQTGLSGLGTQGLQAGQSLMNLGQSYIGESADAVRQRYMDQQNALVAGSNEQTLAGIRNNLFQTGRGGLATGATTAGGMAATNPEMAAYYNSLANQQRQIAAGADTAAQNQVTFGQGLLNSASSPFSNVFNTQKSVEAAGQQPLELSTNLANTVSTRGAAVGANYAAAMNPSLTSQYNAANYNPLATGLQGAASNPLVGYGLMQAWG